MSIMEIIWEEEDFQIFYDKRKKLKAFSTFQFLKKWCSKSNMVWLNHYLSSYLPHLKPHAPQKALARNFCQKLILKTYHTLTPRLSFLILDCPKPYISFKNYVKYYMVFLQSL